jgi:adenylate cyclase
MFPWPKTDLLRKALRLHAGDNALRKVLRDGEVALRLNARTVELTVLFLDGLGFDAQTEGMNAVELCKSMTVYYNLISKPIARCGGTLDAFFGRSAVAWWGENGESDHALRACECARELLVAVDGVNAERTSAVAPKVRFKIGINTGIVALGNFGSSDRLRYTVMGDEVTLASSLCNVANSHYAFPILLSRNTNAQLAGKLQTELVDNAMVKGRDARMEIYGIAA